jgi:large subunit ribosomal protein L21
MYAIVRDGNRSVKVEEGAVVRLDLRAGAAKGDRITLDRVEFVAGPKPLVGAPVVPGARVTAEVRREVKGDKLVSFKYRRRKGYERKKGHRQRYTEVKILKVEA